ncbi:MAG: ribosomal subunit interface protein [Opitutae bacterium]|jgi:putative sigma-54 modulation protein|nr:ribosomal subunit interface protein [Opitutae bacterium]|tara:strand:- start:864 stop:1232 length:369 start_codon:yes stop_codon:yes gene_type:complete
MNEKVILSGLHMNLTDALKATVMEKTERLFKHEEHIMRVRVELESKTCSNTHKDRYVAKGYLELRGSSIIMTDASNDLYKSIDRLVDKLDRGLRRRSRLKVVKRKQSLLSETIALSNQPYPA